jgi:hypothetical protein
MTRPRLYAAVYRYHAPQGDGSVGVAVFNQPPDWKTTPSEDRDVEEICGYVCDGIESGEFVRGQCEFFWDGPGPTPETARHTEEIARSYDSFYDWAHGKFTVGLFCDLPDEALQ